MEMQVTEYINVAKRAEELGFNVPTRLAILPSNYDTATSSDALVDEGTAPTIRSLLRQSGVVETRLEKNGIKLPQSAKKSAEWVSPIIYISQAILADAVVPLTINIISNYLYDLFKGQLGRAQVVIRFASEQTTKTTNNEEEKKSLLVTFKGTPQEWQEFDVNKLKQLLESKIDE